MASLGSENRSASTQILHFLTSHECIIRVGLHYSNLFSLAGLQELSLLTGVISRSITFEVANLEIEAELASNLSRIQRQMISLMANFGHQDCLIKKVNKISRFPPFFLLEIQVVFPIFLRFFFPGFFENFPPDFRCILLRIC